MLDRNGGRIVMHLTTIGTIVPVPAISTSFAIKSWPTGPVAGRGSSSGYLFLSIKVFLVRFANREVFVCARLEKVSIITK